MNRAHDQRTVNLPRCGEYAMPYSLSPLKDACTRYEPLRRVWKTACTFPFRWMRAVTVATVRPADV